ncbi:MAG TPA: protein-disulfide reductase DsbD domain-containing protein [Pyrinomonadaceae bacterium]|nr:protein-disulfide reductase DsbD domain-containing protein [Pyrinomonadaceae bacterium]
MIKHSLLSNTVLLMAVLLVPATLYSTTLPPQSSNDVKVSGSIAPDKIKKGRTVKANVVMEIPQGLHVQSNKPLDKFLIATKLEVETPTGMKVGPISYPRALMRSLKFSKSKVAVYEGRTSIRFPVTVPANYSGGSGEIRGRLRFQACNDESCFPPVTREVKMWLNIE